MGKPMANNLLKAGDDHSWLVQFYEKMAQFKVGKNG